MQNTKIKMKIQNAKLKKEIEKTQRGYKQALEEFKFKEALMAIWELIGFCDRYIERERPWEKDKKPHTRISSGGERKEEVIANLLLVIGEIAEMLKPFLPETSEKILSQLKTKKVKQLFPWL